MDEVFSPGVPGMWIIDIFIRKTQFKFHFLMELSRLSSLSSGLQTYTPNCLGSQSTCILSGTPTSSLPPTCPIIWPPSNAPLLWGGKLPCLVTQVSTWESMLTPPFHASCPSQCVTKASWFSSPEPILLLLNYQLHLVPGILQELPVTPHPDSPHGCLLYSAGIMVIFFKVKFLFKYNIRYSIYTNHKVQFDEHLQSDHTHKTSS